MTTTLTRSRTLRTVALAAGLGLIAGGAFARDVGGVATSLGYSAGPTAYQSYRPDTAVSQERPLTVMGMTGGIEAKDPSSTGSIVSRPSDRRPAR